MKNLTIALPALLLLVSGCCLMRETYEEIPLWKDFSFAEQDPANRAFRFSKRRWKTKQWPSLVQVRQGSIRFYTQAGSGFQLLFSLQNGGKGTVASRGRVVVESDYPSKSTRTFEAMPGFNQIELPEFSGRVVRITFMADRWKGPLIWLNPVARTSLSSRDDQGSLPTGTVSDEPIKAAPQNLLLVLFDAASPFHLGCYGYSRSTSPNIDSVAKSGILWENAISPAVYTRAAFPSIMTGLYPESHGVLSYTPRLQTKTNTMARAFRSAGFETAIFSSNPNASIHEGNDYGFRHVANLWRKGPHPMDENPVMADEFEEPFADWLDQVRSRRFFAYLHIREPHWPYIAPADFQSRFARESYAGNSDKEKADVAGYDSSLAFADSQFGKILHHLDSLGLTDKTMIGITADHGEGLGQHNRWGHMFPVYEEQIRVPLIFRIPESGLKNVRLREAVATIDLMPTVIDLFGLSRRHSAFDGISLLPVLRGATPPSRSLFAQAHQEKFHCIRSTEYKYIRSMEAGKERDELFLLNQDPQELQDRSRDFPILTSYLKKELAKNLSAQRAFYAARKQKIETKSVVDEQEREQLKALGYTDH